MWEKLEKCVVCKRFPLILPVGRKEMAIMCDHGVQQVGVISYKTASEWNAAQINPAPSGSGEKEK